MKAIEAKQQEAGLSSEIVPTPAEIEEIMKATAAKEQEANAGGGLDKTPTAEELVQMAKDDQIAHASGADKAPTSGEAPNAAKGTSSDTEWEDHFNPAILDSLGITDDFAEAAQDTAPSVEVELDPSEPSAQTAMMAM